MRILKTKIAKVQEIALLRLKPQDQSFKSIETKQEVISENSPCLTVKIPEIRKTSGSIKRVSKVVGSPQSPQSEASRKGMTSAKNIIKNYGRALVNFAASDLALPYLNGLASKQGIEVKDFRNFIATKKKQARCIKGLRELLLVRDGDNNVSIAYKRIFKDLAVIFIKYFSVNWIFGGKLCDKKVHLKYRFKILRRIQNPEYFTYLKGFS